MGGQFSMDWLEKLGGKKSWKLPKLGANMGNDMAIYLPYKSMKGLHTDRSWVQKWTETPLTMANMTIYQQMALGTGDTQIISNLRPWDIGGPKFETVPTVAIYSSGYGSKKAVIWT